jgi:hypothetical protein
LSFHSAVQTLTATQLLLHDVAPPFLTGFEGAQAVFKPALRGEFSYLLGAASLLFAALLCTAKPAASTCRALFLAMLAQVWHVYYVHTNGGSELFTDYDSTAAKYFVAIFTWYVTLP